MRGVVSGGESGETKGIPASLSLAEFQNQKRSFGEFFKNTTCADHLLPE
jgi:hypothetical protein